MKKLLIHSVLLVTCFYFLSAGCISVFSKIGKATFTEISDLDKDAPDDESKDNKEDGCDEETFFDCNHILLVHQANVVSDILFIDKKTFSPQHIQEKTSPPPKA